MTTGPTKGPNKRKEQIAMLMVADKAGEVPVVADAYRLVVGVDTHAGFHCYAIVAAGTGRVLDEATFPTSRAGLARAADWIGRRTAGDVEAVHVGWSERHLRAQFTREIGLRPKMAARVIRFHRARHVLQRNVGAGRPNVAGAAAECGYFDQAHLIRDWQQFTGLAPTDWIAHEFRNFQVAGVEDPTSLLA